LYIQKLLNGDNYWVQMRQPYAELNASLAMTSWDGRTSDIPKLFEEAILITFVVGLHYLSALKFTYCVHRWSCVVAKRQLGLYTSRAAGRGRRHRCVELPTTDGRVEVVTSFGGRQHGSVQAITAYSTDCRHAGGGLCWGRCSARCLQCRPGMQTFRRHLKAHLFRLSYPHLIFDCWPDISHYFFTTAKLVRDGVLVSGSQLSIETTLK